LIGAKFTIRLLRSLQRIIEKAFEPPKPLFVLQQSRIQLVVSIR